jgi:RNA polymerase sigma-70 factor (ECF subfamily)
MPTDDELMSAVRAGDRTAFDALFERYRDPVWRFFRRRVADADQAADLAQETYLAIWQGAVRYEPRGAFRSYLFGIAFNLLAAARRSAAARPPVEIEPPSNTGDPADVIWVRRALAELDDLEREIVMLREYEGLSYDEIAALVRVPVGTVRSRLFRAREALREKLVGQPVPQGVRR